MAHPSPWGFEVELTDSQILSVVCFSIRTGDYGAEKSYTYSDPSVHCQQREGVLQQPLHQMTR
ncbi:hypothetical protein NQZ68_028784 [Dissostichus eleginoides]|nr:hypothetical protein NQZ68_028784 [Dissostichus eleginoides]